MSEHTHVHTEVTALPRLLRSTGQKVTPQRLAILSALMRAEGHVTAGRLFSMIEPEHSAALDQSTVYRTLITAERAGLVTRFTQEGADSEFEWRRDDHHHLVCDVCGGVTVLDASVLSSLVLGVQESSGFLLSARHMALTGTCRECLDK
jgi:Fe2+ or Zn2+ uptake regulation protein